MSTFCGIIHKMRIQYRHPKLYEFLVHKLLYPKGLWEKFKLEVGEYNTVFDVGAGYGYASRFVHPTSSYRGIDLNEAFVQHGQRSGIDLKMGDIFDPFVYKESDVFVAIDIIHHIAPKSLRSLFDLIFAHAKKKVIVIDPAFVSIARRYGIAGKLFGWIFSMLDDDGFQKIPRWMSEKEYANLFEIQFGSRHGKEFRTSKAKVGGYHFVTYTKIL